jgi:hypothetical protein
VTVLTASAAALVVVSTTALPAGLVGSTTELAVSETVAADVSAGWEGGAETASLTAAATDSTVAVVASTAADGFEMADGAGDWSGAEAAGCSAALDVASVVDEDAGCEVALDAASVVDEDDCEALDAASVVGDADCEALDVASVVDEDADCEALDAASVVDEDACVVAPDSDCATAAPGAKNSPNSAATRMAASRRARNGPSRADWGRDRRDSGTPLSGKKAGPVVCRRTVGPARRLVPRARRTSQAVSDGERSVHR